LLQPFEYAENVQGGAEHAVELWRDDHISGLEDHEQCVALCETWIKTNMAPLRRGWGPKGERLRGFAPLGHWRNADLPGRAPV
jgi:hypothetical protein